MSMTSQAKKKLSTTIRGLRAHLLTALDDAVESTYRMSVRAQDAGLFERERTRRQRLERWISEEVHADSRGEELPASRDGRLTARFRAEAVKQAAYTLLNRLVLLRILEATGARNPPVVTGGWESKGYKRFREMAPALVQGDDSEGYAFLLQLLFEDLATELPGLYGSTGVADLIPVPAATLRHLVQALDDPELASCWDDDMTLGWVYQYFNDPDREDLDAKLNAGGKVQPHEVASKTQMFTERYMVDWLLQNTLGQTWLAMCAKNGWVAEVRADGTLDRLEERRAEWRAKRDRGEVELNALMPVAEGAEQRWAYWLPQPLPEDAAEHAPPTLREFKMLDPAVGSGHFLVVALDLLFALYKEEARHRELVDDAAWTDAAIVEHILAYNLHGIDLDPRAVQIAAAALWSKAKMLAPACRVQRLNLVASKLRLSSLPENDPALVELRRGVKEVGVAPALTDAIVEAMAGADHLGSLLRVDQAVEAAVALAEGAVEPDQGNLFDGFGEKQRKRIDPVAARIGIVERLDQFLATHTAADDLGLRLRGEQLAAGVRFVRMVQEGSYDLVVGNPPYQGTSKLADGVYVKEWYPLGKADLYAAFLQRGLELCRPGGMSALLTMRNWMFIKQYAHLREWLLQTFDLRALGDFAIGAFDEVPNDVLSVVASVFRKVPAVEAQSVALQPTALDDRSYDRARTGRKRAAVVAGVGRFEFEPAALKVVPEWPLVYWWGERALGAYISASLVPQL